MLDVWLRRFHRRGQTRRVLLFQPFVAQFLFERGALIMHIGTTGINSFIQKAGSSLEKIGKKTEQTASKLSSKAEALGNKLQNFDPEKLGAKLE